MAGAGAIAIAFSGILFRLSGESAETAAMFRCLYALPALAWIASFERRQYGSRPRRERIVAWGAGGLFAIDLVLWHRATDLVGAGLATVLVSLQMVLVAVLAWQFLGEKLGRLTLIAIPTALLGIVFVSGSLEEVAYGQDPAAGVLLGLAAALAYATFLVVLRSGTKKSAHSGSQLFDLTLAAFIVSLVIGVALGSIDLVPSWPSHGWLVLLALESQVAGWLLITTAMRSLTAVSASLVLLVQPGAALALGIALLGEAPSLMQLAGAGLVMLALALGMFARRPTIARPSRVPE